MTRLVTSERYGIDGEAVWISAVGDSFHLSEEICGECSANFMVQRSEQLKHFVEEPVIIHWKVREGDTDGQGNEATSTSTRTRPARAAAANSRTRQRPRTGLILYFSFSGRVTMAIAPETTLTDEPEGGKIDLLLLLRQN